MMDFTGSRSLSEAISTHVHCPAAMAPTSLELRRGNCSTIVFHQESEAPSQRVSDGWDTESNHFMSDPIKHNCSVVRLNSPW